MAERNNPDWIQAFMKLTERTEPPHLYREWVAISTIAAALQRKCFIKYQLGLTWYPNMYIVLVGDAASRKGTAMGFGEDFLEELKLPKIAESITREALCKRMAEVGEIMFADTGKQHSSITIFSPELIIFLGMSSKDNPMMSALTDWFDCKNVWEYETKNKGKDEILGVWVNLLGATTPMLLREKLADTAIGGGLTSRMIFVNYEGTVTRQRRRTETQRERDIKKSMIADLSKIHQIYGEFTGSDTFWKLWDRWYMSDDEKTNLKVSKFDGYNGRRAMHLMKLCMIVSAGRRSTKIVSGEDFIYAKDLLTRVERPMRRVFEGHGRSPDAILLTEIAQFIKVRKVVYHRPLLKEFQNDIANLDQFKKMIAVLVEVGKVKIDRVENEQRYTYIEEPDKP